MILFAKTKTYSKKIIQYYLEIITRDPSICIMDHPDLTVLNFMGNSIRLQRVKISRADSQLTYRDGLAEALERDSALRC